MKWAHRHRGHLQDECAGAFELAVRHVEVQCWDVADFEKYTAAAHGIFGRLRHLPHHRSRFGSDGVVLAWGRLIEGTPPLAHRRRGGGSEDAEGARVRWFAASLHHDAEYSHDHGRSAAQSDYQGCPCALWAVVPQRHHMEDTRFHAEQYQRKRGCLGRAAGLGDEHRHHRLAREKTHSQHPQKNHGLVDHRIVRGAEACHPQHKKAESAENGFAAVEWELRAMDARPNRW
jgi:hypothetical protein